MQAIGSRATSQKGSWPFWYADLASHWHSGALSMMSKDAGWVFRPDIEGFRAIAIGLVVAAHASVPGLLGGFVGVDVFFVISGYLISGMLARELDQTGRIAMASFYLRRVRRLLPVFLVVLVATVAGAWLLLSPTEQQVQAHTGLMATLWISNIYFALAKLNYFAAGSDSSLFLHTWSLGVEEQFYLVWPVLLLVVAGGSRDRLRERLRFALTVTMLLSLVASLILTSRAPSWAFYMMPMRAWEFAVGGLAWFMTSRTPVMSGSGARWLGSLGMVMVVGAGIAFQGQEVYPGWRALFPAFGAALVLVAGVSGEGTLIGRLLSHPVCRYVGRISYGWYLWHWPVLLLGRTLPGGGTLVGTAAAVLVSFLLASLTYALVEKPMREPSRWPSRTILALGLGGISIAFASLVCMLWSVWAIQATSRPEIAQIEQTRREIPAIYNFGCDDWYTSDEVRFCEFGAKNATRTIVLMGDSVAGQWFPTIVTAFEPLGWRVMVLTKSSCPMVDAPYFYERIGREYTECANWRRKALDELRNLKPDAVIISSVISNDFSDHEWLDGTRKVLRQLSAAAGQVFLLRGSPILPFNGPDCLARRRSRPGWLVGTLSCVAPLANSRSDHIANLLKSASSGFTNVSFQDWNDLICPDGICVAEQHGVIVYRDSRHISVAFAEAIAPAIGSRLAPALSTRVQDSSMAH